MTDKKLDASYRACARITSASGSSFRMAFGLLPRAKRQGMEALYAFARLTDDLADAPTAHTDRCAALAAWRGQLQDALAGQHQHEIHPALMHTRQTFDIPPELLFELILGCERDVTPFVMADFAALQRYCYSVSCVVGLACVRIWGLHPGRSWQEAEAPALAAGYAFQLTNILRDVHEDRQRGRCYFPASEVFPANLCDPRWQRSPAAAEFLRVQIARIRELYSECEALIPLLSADGRRVLTVLKATYRKLLAQIERSGTALFTKRVRLRARDKASLALLYWKLRWS